MVRQKDIDDANDPKNKSEKQGMVMERKCTDVICCMLFTLFIIAMLGVSVFGI